MRARLAAILAWSVLAAFPNAGGSARADDFYKGKTITIVVGSTPSGAFDIDSRALARHLGDHVPGHPAVVVQNMPGAGSVTAIRYIESTAPKDGTAIGVFLPGMTTQSVVTPEKIEIDFRDFSWLGIVSSDFSRVCYGYGPNGIRTWDDLMKRTPNNPFIMGTTGTGASNYINGASLREIFHANVKIILGFPGSSELRVAAERGELDGDCGGFSSIPTEWIKDDKAHPFVRFAEKLAPGIPDSAVYIGSLAKTDEQRQLLGVLYAADTLGRPFIMSKDVPADHLAIIRKAFDDTMRDDGFLKDMQTVGETVFPLTGDEAAKIYVQMKQAQPNILAEARKIYQ